MWAVAGGRITIRAGTPCSLVTTLPSPFPSAEHDRAVARRAQPLLQRRQSPPLTQHPPCPWRPRRLQGQQPSCGSQGQRVVRLARGRRMASIGTSTCPLRHLRLSSRWHPRPRRGIVLHRPPATGPTVPRLPQRMPFVPPRARRQPRRRPRRCAQRGTPLGSLPSASPEAMPMPRLGEMPRQ